MRKVFLFWAVLLCVTLLVFGTSAADTAEVRYSVDGGVTWTDAAFTDAVSAAIKADAATIELQKNVTLSDGVAISCGNVTLTSARGGAYSVTRGSKFTSSMFTVSGGATLTLSNITLDGNDLAVGVDGAVISLSAASDTVVLEDGAVIQNSNASGKQGGAISAPLGYIVMKEGSAILNCQAKKGGGIALGNTSAKDSAVFDMEGGLISGCSVPKSDWYCGPAMYLQGYATFNMSGGMITENTSGRTGNASTYQDGSIIDGAITALSNAVYPNKITLSGNAIIRGNTGYRWDADTSSYSADTDADLVFLVNNYKADVIHIASDFTGSVGLAIDSELKDPSEYGVIGSVSTAYPEFAVGTVIPGLIDNNRERVAVITAEDGTLGWTNALIEVDSGDMLTRYTSLESALATDNAYIGEKATVTLLGDATLTEGIAVTGKEITLGNTDGNSYKVIRGSKFASSMFTVSGGATLTLANVTLDGNDLAVGVDGAVISLSSAKDTVVLEKGAVIQNSNASGKQGGAISAPLGYIVMKEGSAILNCQAKKGGGIALGNTSTKDSAVFDMEGGLITGCSVPKGDWNCGPAIYLQGYATFNMSGGVITENTSGRTGNASTYQDGSIIDGAVTALPNSAYPNKITLSGNAIIRGNTGYRWDADTATYTADTGADLVYLVGHHDASVLNIASDFTGSVGLALDMELKDSANYGIIGAVSTDYAVGTVITGLIDNNRERVAVVSSSGKLMWTDAVAQVDMDGKITRYSSLDGARNLKSDTAITLLADVILTFDKKDESVTVIENGHTFSANYDGGFVTVENKSVTVGAFSYGGYETAGTNTVAVVYTAIDGGSITGACLTLGTDLSMNFYAEMVDVYKDAFLRVTRNGVSIDLEGNYVEDLGRYRFEYTDIAPQNAGDLLTAELICGDKVLDSCSDYSVRKYCTDLLSYNDSELELTAQKADELRVLTRALLEYCAMAQVYRDYNTDALVNEGLEPLEFYPMTSTPRKITVHNTVSGVSFVGAGLRYANVNNLYFTFTTDSVKNTRLVVNGTEHTAEEFTLVGDKKYMWYTDDLYATQMDEIFTVELYSGKTLVQTVTYSAAAYVYSMLSYEEEAMQNLAKATYNYGMAARVYTDKLTSESFEADKLLSGGALKLGGASVSGTALTMGDTASGIAFSFCGKGDVVVSLTAASEAQLSVMVDGKVQDELSVSAGTSDYTVATDLVYGKHTVRLLYKSGAVTLNSVTAKGYLVETDDTVSHDIILEFKKAEDSAPTPYEDFFVYVRTSDPSGQYYVRYIFDYAYNTTETGGANYQNNADLFRINTAKLVRVDEIGEQSVSYTDICGLLTGGEIAFAFGVEGAVDSVGGYHGDEHVKAISLLADGIAYTPGLENRVVTCFELGLDMTSVINRCNTPGDDIVNHTQHYVIDKSGIHCAREVEWLTGDVTLRASAQGASLQMFTMRHVDGDKTVCEIVEIFDEDGNSIGKEVLAAETVSTEYGILNSKNTRTLRYSSATSGISAEVSFDILDESCTVGGTFVNVRTYDNKWYARFVSNEYGKTPAKGEVWKVDTHYQIDYVAP